MNNPPLGNCVELNVIKSLLIVIQSTYLIDLMNIDLILAMQINGQNRQMDTTHEL